jgi:hypothetical protein
VRATMTLMPTSRQNRSFLPGVIILAASFLITGLSFLLPEAHGVTEPLQAHIRIAIAILTTALFTGSSIWFLSGARHFKAALRKAYTLLCVGLIAFSLALLQLPLAGLFNLWDSWWITSGAVILIFVFTAVLIYLGIRKFARLVQVEHRAESFWLVTGVTLVFAVVTLFASPHLIQYHDVKDVPTYLAAVALACGYIFASFFLTRHIAQSIGTSYQQAMRWLNITLAAMSLGAAHEYISTYFADTNINYIEYGIYLWPFLLTGFLLVKAAYEFSLLTAAPAEEGSEAIAPQATDHDYIDSITTLAGLASNPKAIDILLDDVRLISSRLSPEHPLTAADKQRLLTVYRQLEEYFVSGKDPVRAFTQAELRKQLSRGFVAQLGSKPATLPAPASRPQQ